MQCCVPLCTNKSNVDAKSISFHAFPSEEDLRTAWLRGLGIQESRLPAAAVVCSEHFLKEVIYKTESGVREIVPGAIPSNLQVCMICLDTNTKMFLMSKHRLDDAYRKLTGHPLCDQRNLKQTLCVECTQRLMNFRKFRDKSLKARALMMDLVKKHALITRQHIKAINRTQHCLKSSLLSTTLGPDHCDLHLVEHTTNEKFTKLEKAKDRVVKKAEDIVLEKAEDIVLEKAEDIVLEKGEDVVLEKGENRVVVKTEKNEDYPIWADVNLKVKMECDDNDFVHDPLNCDNNFFQCTICLKEFVQECAYLQHMRTHFQKDDHNNEYDTSQYRRPFTAVSSSQSSLITDRQLIKKLNEKPNSPTHLAHTSVFPKVIPERKKVEIEILSDVNSDRQYESTNFQATSQDPITEYLVPIIKDRTEVGTKYNLHTEDEEIFECDLCQRMYKRKCHLVMHLKSHSKEKITCEICSMQFLHNSHFIKHMGTHTVYKPYNCDICDAKFAQINHIVRHRRIHTGERPYACKMCAKRFNQKCTLMRHMKIHTGDKPFHCNFCKMKFKVNDHLVFHMRTHTGDKPYNCKVCNKKFTQRIHLVLHMRTHTGDKPYNCEICFKTFSQSIHVVTHMRTHSGVKPYHCEICNKKFALSNNLVMHMRSHTGDKPYSCKICKKKFALNGNLIMHMRTHTGDKPYSCQICDKKFSRKGNLMMHMRTHTGDQPFSCNICNKKFSLNGNLVKHMRTHTVDDV